MLAPFDGVLSGRKKGAGEFVSEGETLGTVLDLGSLVFVADVPVAAIARVRRGQRAEIHFPSLPGTPVAGVVVRIVPQVNPADQTVPVHIGFRAGKLRLEHSLFGSARIVTGTADHALLVPSSALLRNDETGELSVMIVGPDSVARSVEVHAGSDEDSVTAVSGTGIAPGAQVIVQGQYGLPDSTKVRCLP